ncbi:hypothetical protein HD806DRAFT_528309 [Xylariaceae sp. AK1471]|nr:hypothetical protein HD806DRAFT_528309 [Xylariaceae sp. AK1471]
MRSSRTAPPAPISFDKSGARRQHSFGSDLSDKDKELSRSVSGSWFKRTSSSSSSEGGSKPSSPTVNLYTHCGRHTDQYLFGGHGFKELLKKKN